MGGECRLHCNFFGIIFCFLILLNLEFHRTLLLISSAGFFLKFFSLCKKKNLPESEFQSQGKKGKSKIPLWSASFLLLPFLPPFSPSSSITSSSSSLSLHLSSGFFGFCFFFFSFDSGKVSGVTFLFFLLLSPHPHTPSPPSGTLACKKVRKMNPFSLFFPFFFLFSALQAGHVCVLGEFFPLFSPPLFAAWLSQQSSN